MTLSRTPASVPILVLLGPTASGKTAVSVPLAETLQAEIICLDSRQVFRGMEIGTAQPTAEERARVPHHLIGTLDPGQRFSAGDYGRLARKTLAEIESRGGRALFVGGSGLYLRAMEGGLAEALPHNEGVRQRLRDRAAAAGCDALHAELKALDPPAAARLHANDVQRVTRALEVIHLTGRRFSELITGQKTEHEDLRDRLRIVVLHRPRAELYERIERRTAWLLDNGMIEEVRKNLDAGLDPGLPVFKAHGYPEIKAFLEGGLNRVALENRLAQVTRNYARRQLTWFRSIKGACWLDLPAGEAPEETARRAATLFQGEDTATGEDAPDGPQDIT